MLDKIALDAGKRRPHSFVEPLARARKTSSEQRQRRPMTSREHRKLVTGDRFPAPEQGPRGPVGQFDVVERLQEGTMLVDRLQQQQELRWNRVEGIPADAQARLELDLQHLARLAIGSERQRQSRKGKDVQLPRQLSFEKAGCLG